VLWNSLVIDVTERRLADLERERLRDEVQRATRLEALGRMAGGIAHDFNNLVTVILGHADLALAALPDDAPARRDIASLLTAAERAAALTSQLLAFSNRQATTAPVIDLAAHLRGTAPLLGRLAGDTVHLQIDTPESPVKVRLDPTRADQILTNLVANARDASASGGGAQRSGVVRVAVLPRGAQAVILVADDGVGMDEATIARVFEPFFTTRPAGRGTGLGLPTVQAIVQQGGGEIRIESAPGRGSTFEILLPLVDAPIDAPDDDRPNAPLAGARIVVVDDEDPIRQMVARALGRAGAQVRVADGVATARRLVAEQRPHLLLTDIAMPDGTGWDLARRVRRAQPDLAVVFMTS
jgi:signal transduction histidine kinase